jgi:hypothetical protein
VTVDQLQQFIDRFGSRNLMIAAGAAVSVYVLYRLWNGMQSKPSAATAAATCSCGWSGNVSRFKPTCPRCGKTARLA